MRRGTAYAVTALVLAAPARPLLAQGLTQDEALRLAFPPPATVERRTAFLSEADLARTRALAGTPLDQAVVSYYVGARDGRPLGVAYFDAHTVRTRREVVMVVVTPDARVGRVETLRFDEPPEYRARPAWLATLTGRSLDAGRPWDVALMTGATLTSEAIERAARRALALHAVIAPLAPAGR